MKMTSLSFLLAAIVAPAAATEAGARTCELTIEGNDRIQYDKSRRVVEADCTEVNLTLRHPGRLALAQMNGKFIVK